LGWRVEGGVRVAPVVRGAARSSSCRFVQGAGELKTRTKDYMQGEVS